MTQASNGGPPRDGGRSSGGPGGSRASGGWLVVLLIVLAAGGGVALWKLRGGSRAPSVAARKDAGSAPARSRAPRRRLPAPRWAFPADAPRASMEGVVRDPGGAPVDGAIVIAAPSLDLDDRDEAEELRPEARATTAGGGHYRLAELRPGEYGVTATAAGFLPARHGVLGVRPAEARTGVDLTLGAGGVLLSGRVLDTGAGPVPGARVRALPAGGRIDTARLVETTSDAQGRYALQIEPGSYGLAAEADGYAREEGFLQIDAATTRDFRLNPAARISGFVIQRGSRTPVPGAIVRIDNDESWWFEPREVPADVLGKWEVTGLDPGAYTLSARRDVLVGRLPGKLAVDLATAKADVVIEVDHGRSIAGHARDGAGKSISGARVRVAGSAWSSRAEASATSAPDGAFRLDGVLPGKYQLSGHAKGFAPAERAVSVDTVDLDGQDLTLAAGATVTGRVLGKDGAGVAAATVNAFVHASDSWLDRDPGGAGHDVTDQGGRFQIDDLPPGKLTVEAEHADHGRGRASADLAAGERKEVTVRLGDGAFIAGVVRWDDGKPAAGVSVTGLQMPTTGMPARATAAADGSYRIGPFDKGQVMVSAQRKETGVLIVFAGGGGGRDRRSVTIESGEQKRGVDLMLDRAGLSIAGVVLAPDGKPKGGANVGATAEVAGRNMRAFGRLPGDAKILSADDGSFTIEDLPKGNYTVWAQSPGSPEAEVYPVAAGATGVRVQFRAGARLAGVAIGKTGKPLTDYSIRAAVAAAPDETDEQKLRRRWGAEAASQSVHDPSGAFDLGGLDPGAYDLLVTTPAGGAGRLPGVSVAAGEEKTGLRITVGDGVSIKGRVVDLDGGAPLPHVSVHLLAGAMSEEDGVETDAAGAFQLDGLPPGGTVTLFARGDIQTHVPEQKDVALPESGADAAGRVIVDAGTIKLLRGQVLARGDGTTGTPGLAAGVRDGRAIVDSVRTGSPAAQAGVHPGDWLLTVDGRDVTTWGPGATTYVLAGKIGTKVSVGLQRGGGAEAHVLQLQRLAPGK